MVIFYHKNLYLLAQEIDIFITKECSGGSDKHPQGFVQDFN